MKNGGRFVASARGAFSAGAKGVPSGARAATKHQPVRPPTKGKLTPAMAARIRAKADAILGAK